MVQQDFQQQEYQVKIESNLDLARNIIYKDYVASKLYNEPLYLTQQEHTETNHTSEVVDSGAAEQRQRAQEDFHQQQLVKQQQGFEMRQERQSNNMM